MSCLQTPIGQLLPGWQKEIVTANESDTMVHVAGCMKNSFSELHLSQIPLEDNNGNIQRVVTGNGLARWGADGRPNATAREYSEVAHRFPKETPLGEITERVKDFGYVLVTNDDGSVADIVTYTEVIAELMGTH